MPLALRRVSSLLSSYVESGIVATRKRLARRPHSFILARAPQFFALIFVALTVKRHTRRAYAIEVSLPRRTPGAGARQERTAALTAS
jgi:hypothetical protein